MKERSFDEMIAFFNRRVADMDISQDCKMELLGMVTALGYKHEKTAQPEQHYDEWCTDCKEYNKERHCCPRWNRVIRQTLNDAQRPQWIPCSDCERRCKKWERSKILQE